METCHWFYFEFFFNIFLMFKQRERDMCIVPSHFPPKKLQCTSSWRVLNTISYRAEKNKNENINKKGKAVACEIHLLLATRTSKNSHKVMAREPF